MKTLALLSVRLYQRFLSIWLPPNTCRFTPTCSDYTYQAIAKYGILGGLSLGIKRILRCHPGNLGGFDPIP